MYRCITQTSQLPILHLSSLQKPRLLNLDKEYLGIFVNLALPLSSEAGSGDLRIIVGYASNTA